MEIMEAQRSIGIRKPRSKKKFFNRYFVQFLFVLHAIATNVKRGWVTCFSSSNLPGQHDPQFREVHSLLCCEAMDGQRMGTPSA